MRKCVKYFQNYLDNTQMRIIFATPFRFEKAVKDNKNLNIKKYDKGNCIEVWQAYGINECF
jgi:hypothetical protein